MGAVALLENVTANGTGAAVEPDPRRGDTWRKAESFSCYVDRDASTWDTATIAIWAQDQKGRTYKPGSDTEMTPTGAGAVIVSIPEGHKLKANVSGIGAGEDLYVYCDQFRRG